MKINYINQYTPHIDGLRAIAILSVLLFHFDVSFIPGGFVGVDIFFVISGFLITSHLLSAIDANELNLKSFYSKRIRRLFPALCTTIGLTLLVGFFVLTANDYELLANSSMYSIFPLANVYFWQVSGYWGGDAISKPLLHMWSLSVEEQFYLIWPVLLLTLMKFRKPFLSMFGLGLISYLACIYVLNTNASSAFFLTPLRVYEFIIGASLLWLVDREKIPNDIKEALLLVGFILVSYSIVFYSEETLFPGSAALIPCLGAALLIIAGDAKYLGWFLRLRIVVFTGVISYSLYLVHWPLVVFYKIEVTYQLTKIDKVILLLLSYTLAIALHYCVEKPLRYKRSNVRRSVNKFAVGMACCTILVVGVSLSISTSNGWAWRLDSHQLTKSDIDKGMDKRFDIYREICEKRGWSNCSEPSPNKENNVLVIGDSHAPDALNMFYLAEPEKHYVLIERGGCPPIVESDFDIIHYAKKECEELNIERFAEIAKDKYSVIVISVLFDWYAPEHLINAIKRINSISNAKVIVLGNYIQVFENYSSLVSKGIDITIDKQQVKNFALYENELKDLSKGNFKFISKRNLFCDDDKLESCKLWFDGVPFSYDQHHLSYAASEFASKKIPEMIKMHLSDNKHEN